MRLGQLARKLAIRPAEIMEYLATHNITINENSNIRLDQDQVMLVLQRFAPDKVDELMNEISPRENAMDAAFDGYQEEQDLPIIEITAPVQQVEPAAELPVLEIHDSVIDNTHEPSLPADQSMTEEKIEIIKAPKIALSGLKVVGKIDLPEDKKKESSALDEGAIGADKVGSKKANRKREKSGQASRNPIALAREREAQELAKKRQAEEERRKQKRTENYLKKIKKNDSIKVVSPSNKATEQTIPTEEKTVPKTWIGKFIKWLTNS